MEAVGQLTGGIAHDFNNMLTGIIAALDLMRMRIDTGKPEGIGRLIDTAAASAQRAAGLTQRLLAFSRRQTLDPKPVDVNAMVSSMEELFVRTLGEDTRLQVDLGDGLPSALVDVNQLESALLNLVINARDAMPEGGELTVRTRFKGRSVAEAGSADSVVLSVSDTGIGMDEALIARIFEPFFTTKPTGQGTGLGMSMIYGFIKQSNGNIDIRSAPGRGTTVRLELPVARNRSAVSADEKPKRVVEGRGQSILVVEDDPQVRTLVSELLATLGYTVYIAEDADNALADVPSIPELDLLVTDVGLPGVNGRQLADIVRQTLPALPVLFMTGYAANAHTRAGFLGPGMSMIAKPFDLDDFSSAVARMLEPRDARGASGG
jgi:CheY-like chemotaxis protein